MRNPSFIELALATTTHADMEMHVCPMCQQRAIPRAKPSACSTHADVICSCSLPLLAALGDFGADEVGMIASAIADACTFARPGTVDFAGSEESAADVRDAFLRLSDNPTETSMTCGRTSTVGA